jgi:hypothetical protein
VITVIAGLNVAVSSLGKKRCSLVEGASIFGVVRRGEKEGDEAEREVLLGV